MGGGGTFPGRGRFRRTPPRYGGCLRTRFTSQVGDVSTADSVPEETFLAMKCPPLPPPPGGGTFLGEEQFGVIILIIMMMMMS